MGLIVGGLAALIVGAWWLRGGWVLPTLLTVGFVIFGGVHAFAVAPAWAAAVVLVLWVPLMAWRYAGRTPRPLIGPGRVMVGVERR